MTDEVKALILSFAKELAVREIASKNDFEEICKKLNLSSKESREDLFKKERCHSLDVNRQNFRFLD